MTYHTGNQLVDPHILFGKVHMQPSMHVADLGSGRTGHIVFPAAKVIGDKGVVYAVDILKDALESIRKRAQMEGFHNIHEVWADIEQTGSVKIPSSTIDVVFAVNVLFHFSDYTNTLEESLRLLKEKGRIVIVDWTKGLANMGPTEDQRVNFSILIAEARKMGCAVQNDFAVGPYHRAVILYRH